jgi:ribosomal protein S18 acetylase RimI-like enzyme
MSYVEQAQLKSLAEFSLNAITDLWNTGFQQDYSNVMQTSAQRLRRMGRCHIQPELSVVCCIGEQPVGFILIGLREVQGRKLAWNGGTGVVPAFRRRGLSKLMLGEAIRRVKEAGAESLHLEALTHNAPAVRAYSSCGFVIVDRLHTLHHKSGALNEASFVRDRSLSYMSVRGKPQFAGQLPFYNDRTTSWICQWFNLQESESLIVYDPRGHAAGYATFKEEYGMDGRQWSVELYQCEADPSRDDGSDLIRYMLAEIMKPSVRHLSRRAYYLRDSNGIALAALTEAGFQQIREKEEYLMELPLSFAPV